MQKIKAVMPVALSALVLALASISGPADASGGTATSEADWVRDSAAGKSAYEQCNWGQAEKSFKAAIREAETFGSKDVRLANSLTSLGVLYNCRGQNAKAAPLFERAIAIKQSALGPENPEVVQSVGKLCQFYLSHNEYSKADPVGTKLAAFAQKTVKDRQSVASSFSRLQSFYQAHKEYKDAESFLGKAEEETKKITSNQDLEFAVMLDGLGDSFKSAGKLSLSEQLLSNALAIREQSLPPQHAAIAASCRHLGGLYLLEGNATQAEPLLKKAVQINTRAVNGNKADLLASMDDLAACYQKTGHNRDAETLYKEQLESARETYGLQSKPTANALLALASFLMKTGRAGEAATYFGQALNISEKANGSDSSSLTPILENYAEALDKSNRKSEAKKYLARAKAIRG
jgi:lipopolysaccharide biosynthesis regulator YciM